MSTLKSTSTKETNVDGIIIGLILLIGLLVCISLFQKNGTAIQLKLKRLLTRNAHVVVLSTYGPSVEGSPFYEAYVAKAMKYILDSKNNVNELIIVGGYTVDPNISQSQAVLNYIKGKYPAFSESNISVTLDECGITTWQNIRNARRLMAKEGIQSSRITIFAEESREQKIFIFALSEFLVKNEMKDVKDFISGEAIKGSKYAQLLSREKQLQAYASLNMKIPNESYINKNISVRIITKSAGLPQVNVEDEHMTIFQETREYFDPPYGNLKIKERLDNWAKTAGFNTIENLVDKGCAEYKQFLD